MSKLHQSGRRRSMNHRLHASYIGLLLALTILPAHSTPAAAAAEGRTRFEASDLFGLQRVTDPQISPDGRTVAYVRESFDIMTDRARRAIWLVDTATSAQRPIEASTASAGSPRWSPDGKRLAYIVVEGGRSHIVVQWLENGRTARIADVGDGAEDLRWSPDGQAIAFVMRTAAPTTSLGTTPAKPAGAHWADPLRLITEVTYRRDTEGYLEPGHPHLFVVSAEGGTARQLTFGAFDDHGPIAWTPDGQALLFSANRNDDWRRDTNSSQIYRVTIGSGALAKLTNRVGPATDPQISPDGRTIAYLGYDDRMLSYQDSHIYLMSADGASTRVIGEGLNRSVSGLQWASDGRSLLIQYADAGTLKVTRLTLDGGMKPVATGLAGSQLDRPYTLGAAFSVARNGTVAFASGSSEGPAELSIDRGGRITRLTRLNDTFLAGKALARTRQLTVRSSFDQRSIDAWLVTPPGFDPAKKYPMILEIHGGPSGSYGDLFATDMQLYAAAGYIVVYANPRGSSGYGEAFANLIQGAFPGHDFDDLMSVVDAAVATGSVERDQLFVTGGSAGGELTAWIVGKTNRFRAAAVQKPVINAISYVLTTDEAGSVPLRWFGKMPWEDVDTYWKHSPLSLVGNVVTPTLIVVGGEDYRTPVSEAEQFYEALQLRGVPTALIEVPHAGHLDLTARPSQSAAKASAILAWFDRYRSAPSQQPKAAAASARQ